MLEQVTPLQVSLSLKELIESLKMSGNQLVDLFETTSCIDVIPSPNS